LSEQQLLTPLTFYFIFAFGALMLLVWRQEAYPACKKLNGGMMEWVKVQICICSS